MIQKGSVQEDIPKSFDKYVDMQYNDEVTYRILYDNTLEKWHIIANKDILSEKSEK